MARAMRTLGQAMVVVFLASCQTYDFEPVTPLTFAQTIQSKKVESKKLKPNLMLLVDKSGSMRFSADPGCSGSGCPTRIGELRTAMSTFLAASGSVARMGLTFFPADVSCGAPSGAPAVELPAPTATDEGTEATLIANASTINSRIAAVTPNGGTPTTNSLSYVGTIAGLNQDDSRPDYVLLLTDGLPNCNTENVNNVCSGGAAQLPVCRCQTFNSGMQTCTNGTNPLTSNCAIGCLDLTGVVDAVKGLLAKNIKTIVVGFGADTSGGDGAEVLQAMANAGGFPRECNQDSECGSNNSCNTTTHLCVRQFYQASNATELATALANVSAIIQNGNPCVFQLDAQPTDQRYISVLWNGAVLAPAADTWSYSGGSVTFPDSSTYCSQIKSHASEINIEFRIVEQL